MNLVESFGLGDGNSNQQNENTSSEDFQLIPNTNTEIRNSFSSRKNRICRELNVVGDGA